MEGSPQRAVVYHVNPPHVKPNRCTRHDNRENEPENRQNPRRGARALALPRQWQPSIPLGLVDWRSWLCRGIVAGNRPAAAIPLDRRLLRHRDPAVLSGRGPAGALGAVGWRWRCLPRLPSFSGRISRRWRSALASRWCSPVSRPAPFDPAAVEAPVLGRIAIGPISGFIEAVEDRAAGQARFFCGSWT